VGHEQVLAVQLPPVGHTVPHVLQLAGSLARFTHAVPQRLGRVASLVQAIPQLVPLHVATPLEGAGQAVHIAPHEVGSILLTHVPPQSCMPAGHAQAAFWHVLPPVHTFAEPQPPQWFGSLVVLTSQPFATSMSQSAKPALHDAMAQLELLQTGVALGVVHALPQVPQLLRSLVVWISQPFDATLSQSAKPALHEPMAHIELLQAAVALGSVHTLLHVPQLLGSLVVLTHEVPLQSVGVAAGQPDTHIEDEHNGVPPVHALWQSPQLVARARFVSQPFATIPSQSL